MAAVGPLRKARGPNPTLGLPSPKFSTGKESFYKNLAVKISEDSGCPGEIEGS